MSSFYVSCIGAEKFKSAEQALADVPGGMERALRSATKRAASFLRTQSTKEIRQRYDITRKNIRAEQNVNVSYRYFNGIEARIAFRGNKIPLWRYGGSSPSKPTVNTEKTVMAIVNGTPLPDTVAVRALAYIRSKLLSTADADKKPLLSDTMACQWLKVWLIRKRRMRNEEENLMEYYEPNFPNAAYHCGAWLAVYANLQRAAMGDVNATLVQRFYASASRTPALVFGTLDRMGQVYLDILRKEKRGLDRIYEDKLNAVCAFFGSDLAHCLPTTLNLEGQSYFALGYHQMCTQITGEIRKRIAEKQEG